MMSQTEKEVVIIRIIQKQCSIKIIKISIGFSIIEKLMLILIILI